MTRVVAQSHTMALDMDSLTLGKSPRTSSPAPLMRASARGSVPRLVIPASPRQKAVDQAASQPQRNGAVSVPAPPPLRLSTPMGTESSPQEVRHSSLRGRLPPLVLPNSNNGSSDTTPHSRSGSSGESTIQGRPLNELATFLKHSRSEDAISAASSFSAGGENLERRNSMTFLPDFAQLSLEKGRPLDVDDLDDAGWHAASVENKIIELGSLGEGAGGAVTRCILEGGKTVFALKVITTDPNPDVKKQILRELRINKSCVSDHICRYYGAFMNDDESRISIAMEFCEGGSLDSVYREVKRLGGRTGEKVLGKIAEGVLNGLTYLWSKRIIHRDIKPSNILLCRNGQVKLIDFGVSGDAGTNGAASTFIGTSYYMAPERISGQDYTITSDVWSLGVTLLEVAQHRFPFPANDEGGGEGSHPQAGLFDLLTYIVKSPVPTLKDEPNNKPPVKWSDRFKNFIEYSLEKDKARRPTPWNMLKHPWIIEMKGKRVNMDLFLKTVWKWED